MNEDKKKIDIKAYIREHWKRIVLCFVAVFGMGFFLSFLVLCNLGTDPFTFMNLSISAKIGLSLGNWQLILNVIMLVVVIIANRKLIGLGTIFNMVLIGYYVDFFDWVWGKVIPETVFTNPVSCGIVYAIALIGFVISAALYMNAEVGVSPYDACSQILADVFHKIPFFIVRIVYDFTAIGIGLLAGGKPIIGIILMAILLGPVVSFVGKRLNRQK